MIGAPRSTPPPPPAATSELPAGLTFELQELWFSLMRLSWRSLAFVPAHPVAGGGQAAELARRFAVVGRVFRGASLTFLDATSLELESAARISQQLQGGSSAWSAVGPQAAQQADTRTVVALDAVVTNALSIPVALATDGVVLVIEKDVTTRASAERTVQLIGRELIVGAVMLGR